MLIYIELLVLSGVPETWTVGEDCVPVMTDDGGIAPQNNTCTNRSTRMIIIHRLCRWNVNKYNCTAIFGNVLCNIQSSIVMCI